MFLFGHLNENDAEKKNLDCKHWRLGLGLCLQPLLHGSLFFRGVTDLFLRTVCHMRLRHLLPECIVSTEELSGDAFNYYKEFVASVRFLLSRLFLNKVFVLRETK